MTLLASLYAISVSLNPTLMFWLSSYKLKCVNSIGHCRVIIEHVLWSKWATTYTGVSNTPWVSALSTYWDVWLLRYLAIEMSEHLNFRTSQFQAPSSPGIPISRCWDIRELDCQDISTSGLSKCPDIQLSRHPNIRTSKCPDVQTSGHPNIRTSLSSDIPISRHVTSQ